MKKKKKKKQWTANPRKRKRKKKNNEQPTQEKERKKEKKKKNSQPGKKKKRKKKSQKWSKVAVGTVYGLSYVFNYKNAIELWVMKTENNQNLFSVSITHNSKIRELSDGNRVIVC